MIWDKLKWEKTDLLERVSAYDEVWVVVSEDGEYVGTAEYSCDTLVDVYDIQSVAFG